jgi:hypothetical protein
LKEKSCRIMRRRKKSGEKWKTKFLWTKQNIFLAPCPSALRQFQPHGCM